MSTMNVFDDPDRGQYTITVDGQVAGHTSYRLENSLRILTHTEVKDEFAGQGIGSVLAEGALGLAAESQARIVPSCPFIARHIRRHPEWRRVVADEALTDMDD